MPAPISMSPRSRASCDDAPGLGSRGFLGGAVRDELDADHRAQPADVADHLVALLHRRQRGRDALADLLAAREERRILHLLERDEAGGARERVAAERAAQTADVRCIHEVGATRDAGQRQPAAERLAPHDQIGLDARHLVDGQHGARPAHAGLHLVVDVDHAVLAADLDQSLDEAGRGGQEAALALHGLVDDRGHRLGVDLALEQLAHGGQRLGRADPAVGPGRRGAVDLGHERAEALLVGHDLGGQRHAEHRAAVEALVERDDRVAIGRVARDLDRVLDGLGARVDEQRLLREGARVQRADAPADLDVRLVHRDREALVHVALGLFLHRSHDRLGRVAAVERADSADEVDVLPPVDVGQAGAVRSRDEDRRRRHSAGYVFVLGRGEPGRLALRGLVDSHADDTSDCRTRRGRRSRDEWTLAVAAIREC